MDTNHNLAFCDLTLSESSLCATRVRKNGNSAWANLLRSAIFFEWRYFVSRQIQAHFSATPSLACFVNKTGTLPCFTVARLLRALHWQLLGTANLDISILIYFSIRIRFHFTTAYMWFHQDTVALRLTVVCVD